jgi:V/A-type H+-transporting ATPase subunit C
MSSKSIPDFIRKLKGTLYYEHLRPLLESKVEPTLFNIGMILDLAYFDMIYKSLRLIGKHDRELMNYIEGINVDLLNLQWIYRGLKFYNLPPEILFNYTIAYGREFNRDDIKELCYSKHLDEFQKRIVNTKYSFLFDNENTKDIFMERRIYRYLYFKIMIALKKRDGMNIAQAVIYSMLSEVEIRDIISVVENIRYGMAVLEAKKFVIRKL